MVVKALVAVVDVGVMGQGWVHFRQSSEVSACIVVMGECWSTGCEVNGRRNCGSWCLYQLCKLQLKPGGRAVV